MRLRHTIAALALWSSGCAVIVGTDDFEPCTGDGCLGSEGGGVGGSGGTCDAGSFTMTVIRKGGVEVRTDPVHHDFDDENPPTRCVQGGTLTLEARCATSSDSVAVTWGNDLCAASDGTAACSFELVEDETFTVTATAPCSAE